MRHRYFVVILYSVLAVQCSAPGKIARDAAGQGRKPVIGVSASFSGGRNSAGEDYCTSVRKAGGTPVILPLVGTSDEAAAAVALVDGLLMTGGEDVNPAYYGEAPINETVSVNSRRDTSDFLLLGAAEKRALPVLGICRGEQIVNVFYGGSLIQDIPSQAEAGIRHRQSEPKSTGTHWIYLKEGTRLRSMTGADSLLVNTFHHQAVKKPAPGFVVSAVAADGIIEAYETPSGSRQRILGVQFHPEGFVHAGDFTLLPLFQEFIRDCRQ